MLFRLLEELKRITSNLLGVHLKRVKALEFAGKETAVVNVWR